ncbi:PIG-X-domain-containing protein [Xylariaceae sp. FL0594]|nr:PIG-X-domain-containing protein [Xylariaceae sp. FL0594]
MRQRITFLHRNEHGVEPSAIQVGDRSLTGPDVLAVREHRVTLALEELPAELRELLRDINELHIRWSTLRTHDTLGPWNSRLPPGLHVFYTPRTASAADSPELCEKLRAYFGKVLDCSTPSESFTKLPTDRFTHSTAFQYFHNLDVLPNLPSLSEEHAWAEGLASAASLDVSYDAISGAVKITALWPEALQKLSIVAPRGGHRTEVGILTPDSPAYLEPHELGVTGLLTVLGEDSKPSAVMFGFPSRHKDAGSDTSFSSRFLRPHGLHPTLQLTLDSSSTRPPASSCSLHAYLTLPRTVFADKYQLGDDLFLASKNLTALRYISQPVDLEAPDYAMKVWGSSVLLELQPPRRAPTTTTTTTAEEGTKEEDTTSWTAEIPLHLRYLAPAEGGYGTVNIPWPVVFWACNAEEGTKFPNSPFDRVNLGYDGLFGPRTLFWHVSPRPEEAGGSLVHQIRVPVLDSHKTAWINTSTTAVVLLGFAYILWRLATVYLRTGYGGNQRTAVEGEKKKKQ